MAHFAFQSLHAWGAEVHCGGFDQKRNSIVVVALALNAHRPTRVERGSVRLKRTRFSGIRRALGLKLAGGKSNDCEGVGVWEDQRRSGI